MVIKKAQLIEEPTEKVTLLLFQWARGGALVFLFLPRLRYSSCTAIIT